MRHGKIMLFSMLLLLAACRDPGQGAQEAGNIEADATTDAAAQPVEEAPKPAVEKKTTFASPVAGVFTTLPFAYHVSVDREVTRKSDGQKAREVGIEFLDTDVAVADQAIVAEFEKAGFTQSSREDKGKATRTVYAKPGHGDVLVWVRPGAPRGERYALQMAEAKGTIYLAYPLSN